jgi:16S rRNA (guanine(966)-N(2))-methyltransferase RsmD
LTRIIGGGGKGRRLAVPAGRATRPTGARVRQTLFDILAPDVPGCRFLDACAGSGAVGLEALSRGAAEVVLVERDAAAFEALRRNARALGAALGALRLFRQDARTALVGFAAEGAAFDVIYLDPPYDSDLYEPLLETVGARGLLQEGGVAVAEHFHKRPLLATIGGLARAREVRVGDHRLSFYRHATRGGRP